MNKLLIILIPLLIGCGSLTHGRFQDIPISSNPCNATITVNDEVRGKTPSVINLKRKTEKYTVIISKDGYISFTTILTRSKAPAVLADMMLDFGLISYLLVDKQTGAAYHLLPKAIHVELREKQ